ncbi:MAG: carbohydrate binding family 9 domain-containing protein [Bacteroidales bacterium]|nr:carbohydrate binding family 9 domain-containing protein [Bacteroidales bacterium]
MRLFFLILLLIPAVIINAQQKKTVQAFYITEPITVDGILDEPAYSQATPANDFVQLQPYNGRPAYRPTEVYILYDQTAIYIGGMMHDDPDSIYNFLSERDNIGRSDYFGIYFDPYNQGQLAYGFFITPAGSQTDIKAIKTNGDNEDGSWDAVWQSKTRVTDKGWILEMKIPYSALRFPENGNGTWGLNMFRNIRRHNSNNSWNFIDRQVSGFIHQEGELTGIKDIRPPVRLSVSPYAAAYTEFKTGKSKPDFTYKGGMDVKYGLSESFTLDMMLVPDFGQIQSDDKRLNLSPYELFYSEKRQFFTEGTELFDRGEIFYSRRIGANPKFSGRIDDEKDDREIVDYNPTETQLLNATKVSGRTTKGWGLGLLNAMSLPSNAVLKDSVTGEKRDVLIQPFTNYNVAVIDKSLKNNSYISLINTNMFMANDPFRANVTATDFQIRNKKKTYAVNGKGGYSTRTNGEHETGYFADLGFEKNSGKLQFGISQSVISDKYNPNDMGYLRRNNELETEAYIYYGIVEPFGIFRQLSGNIWFNHDRMYEPWAVSGNEIGIHYYNQFKNNYGFEAGFNVNGTDHDYYVTRVAGRYFKEPWHYEYYFWGFTSSTKPVIFQLGFDVARQPDTDQRYRNANVYISARVGRHLQLSYSNFIENQINDRGYVDKTDAEDSIFFAKRNVNTLENVINATYTLNNKSGISFRLRHYWSGAENKEFFQLQEDGTLLSDVNYTENKDNNYNAFNIDLVFRWIFAPGSELSLAWKNAISTSGDRVIGDYWNNFSKTWKSDQINSLSLKILYYIDYNSLRGRKK